MSSLTLETLRALCQKRGESLGWGPFGDAVGVDGETLRAFVKTPGRKLQPATKQALERYFAPSSLPSAVAVEVRDALAKAREVVAVLERLSSLSHDDAASIAAADQPTPSAPAGAKPVRGRASARG